MVNRFPLYLLLLSLFVAISVLNSCGPEESSQNESDSLTDSLEYVVNFEGDTVETGKPIPVQPWFMYDDSLPEPRKLNMGEVNEIPANTTYTLAKLPEVKQVLEPLLVEPGTDTLVPIVGNYKPMKSVPFTFPKWTRGGLPRYRDNAFGEIKYLDVDQGMASSYCLGIFQDSKGFIWIPNYVGISRYDGTGFLHFTQENGIPSILISSIDEDSKGRYWMSSRDGLIMYDGSNLWHLPSVDSSDVTHLNRVIVDDNDNVWIQTHSHRCFIYDENQKLYELEPKNGGPKKANALHKGNDNDVWVSINSGLLRYKDQKYYYYGERQGFPSGYNSQTLEVAGNGDVWLGISNGVEEKIVKFDGNTFTIWGREEGYSMRRLRTMVVDHRGDLWMGSDRDAVLHFDMHAFKPLNTDRGLSHFQVLEMIEDDNHNLWIGTEGAGVNYYNNNSFHHTTKDDGLLDDISWAIYQDHDGNWWNGSILGMTKNDGQTYRQYSQKGGLEYYFVRKLDQKEGSDTIWGAARRGPFYMIDDQMYELERGDQFPTEKCRTLFIDSEETVWFTTEGGVIAYRGGTYEVYDRSCGLMSENLFEMTEDVEGNYWLGSDMGVIKLEDGLMTNYTTKEGLSGALCMSLFSEENGNVWIGTYGDGLNLWNGEEFLIFNKENGLSNNTIWTINQDDKDRIWLTTEKGINLLTRNDSSDNTTHGYDIVTFEKADGLKGEDFYSNASFIDKNNRIWFGSGKALTSLDLNEFEMVEYAPKLFMNAIDINQQSVQYRSIQDSISNHTTDLELRLRESFDTVPPFQTYPERLNLPYDINHLTFHFGALEWSAPHKLKYSYYLEGLEDDWCTPTSENKADYRSIPYGDYTFRLKAVGESGIWSEPLDYKFSITPPWWHTTLARVLYVLVLLILIGLLVRWRTSQLKKRQRELEHIVEERTAEVVHQKEELAEQHQEITDSIQYAKRLQDAILPAFDEIDNYLENFVLFKPKDVVSGDFYWFEQVDGKSYIAAADCTGHGVPGAMVSVVCSNALNRSVNEFGLRGPAEILDMTRKLVIETFAKSGEGVKDGMDISMVRIDPNSREIVFAGANNPLWVVGDRLIGNDPKAISEGSQTLSELKGDKQPVGLHDQMNPFTDMELQMQAGDVIYLFSDGFADQFGGDKGKKLKYAPFKKLLLSVASKDMATQSEELANFFSNWRGSFEQLDDVCVIGVRL